MAINTADLVRAGRSLLATVGTQRYTDEEDFVPAINGASRAFEAYMGGFLAEKKGSEEAFREVTRTVVYQTNTQGGIFLDDPDNLQPFWTLIAIYAEPQTLPVNPSPVAAPDSGSVFRGDVAFAGAGKPVERITQEEYAKRKFSLQPGSERLANNPAIAQYAYYWVGDRSTVAPSTVWPTQGQSEIVVVPKALTSRKLVGVSYLRTAPLITAVGQFLPYPVSMFNLIRDLMLNQLTYKQGDGTTLNGLTERDIARLLNIQS